MFEEKSVPGTRLFIFFKSPCSPEEKKKKDDFFF